MAIYGDEEGAIARLNDMILAGKLTCSPQFVVDLSYIEAQIRDATLEYDINSEILKRAMKEIPEKDLEEFEAWLEKIS